MSVVKNVKKVSSSFLILSMLLLATAFYASTANAQTPTVAPTFDVAAGSSVGSIHGTLGSYAGFSATGTWILSSRRIG